MEDGSLLPFVGILLFIIGIWTNGIFYGFASAVRNLNENDLEERKNAGDRRACLLFETLQKPFRYINAVPVLVLLLGILSGCFLIPYAESRFGSGREELLMLLLSALLVLIFASFSILLFRRLGTHRPERFAYRHIQFIRLVSLLLLPFTSFVTFLAKVCAVPFGVGFNEKEKAITEEAIISILDEAHEQGVIEENEAEMIQNIISFNETSAGDIMTHRKDIVAIDSEMLLQEMIDTMLEEGNSRYPVYRGDLDRIIGIVHYKDALKFNTRNSWARFKPLRELPGLIREAVFIPETRGIGDLFHTMQTQKLHMAVVVDEYGQTAGIVTMEDILEEIVGEILDEYDEEENAFRLQKDNSIVIDALADLEDVEKRLGVRFEGAFETLNGVLTSVLGHIPTRKDLEKEMVIKGYRFRIVSLGNKTIGKVRVWKDDGAANVAAQDGP